MHYFIANNFFWTSFSGFLFHMESHNAKFQFIRMWNGWYIVSLMFRDSAELHRIVQCFTVNVLTLDLITSLAALESQPSLAQSFSPATSSLQRLFPFVSYDLQLSTPVTMFWRTVSGRFLETWFCQHFFLQARYELPPLFALCCLCFGNMAVRVIPRDWTLTSG